MDTTDQMPAGVSAIELGDEAAARGDWPTAVALWGSLRSTPLETMAGQRIAWFLAQNDSSASPRHTGLDWRSVLVATGFALLGTVIVLLGDHADGTAARLVAAASWSCFVASAIAIVAFAWRAGRPASPTIRRVEEPDFDRAQRLARELRGPHAGHSPAPEAANVRR